MEKETSPEKMEKETSSEKSQVISYGPLGSLVDNKYIVGPECYKILGGFLQQLQKEDKTLRSFRRSFDFSQNIQRDLMPLLVHVNDQKEITQITIKILANLTTPVDSLLPTDIMTRTEVGKKIVDEINWILFSCIEPFLEVKTTRRIVENIRDVIEKGDKMNEEDFESLNDCLILLRNILHLPEVKPSEIRTSSKNQIIWNLFAQNMDKVLIELMNIKQKGEWTLALVQIVSLLYKDQNAVAFGKLLSMRMEASFFSESSDNESNTERRSKDSFRSDYSDFSGSEEEATNKSSRKLSKQNMLKNDENLQHIIKQQESKKESFSPQKSSDGGYGTQQSSNQGSVSPSSNDDDAQDKNKPVHQKPVNMIHRSRVKSLVKHQEKEDQKRKKLMKRSRTNVMNMKALIHHTPSNEDISQLLKEFTLDFLLKGYNPLLSGLFDLVLQTRIHVAFDNSHFFWLVRHFLKFAVQLELDLEYISSVLSYKIVSFLTFEAVELSEQIENAQSDHEMTPFINRIHLVVNTLKEVLHTIDSYEKIITLNEQNKMQLLKLKRKICETKELRCLFVLLLRKFDPRIHSIQYLQDVIVTNHMLLSFIDGGSLPNTNAILLIHLRQFVAVDIMGQYGRILETFQQNGQFLNDCVFTMMHHVAGDLESVSALFQPKILKAFSEIWETDFELCDDWNDLVHYVINKFLNIPSPLKVVEEIKEKSKPVLTIKEWTQKDRDCLYWYYIRCVQGRDPVGDMVDLYGENENGVETKTRIGVIEQLLKQDIITTIQYNKLMENEHVTVRNIWPKIYSTQVNMDEIKLLTDNLKQENKFGFVIWIQKVLLDACHAKLSRSLKLKNMIEPVPYYCSLLQEPFPLIAWSGEQCSIMQSQVFLLLLHKLGLVLPSETGKIYARIPHSWSPNTMYDIACKLGPLQSDWIKFDVSLVQTETNGSKRKCSTTNEPAAKMSMSEKRMVH